MSAAFLTLPRKTDGSFIPCTAMRTTPFAVKLGPATPANVRTTGITEITPQRPTDVKQEKRIAEIIQRGERKEQVTPPHIRPTRQTSTAWLPEKGVAANVLHRCYGQNDYQPHGSHEQAQNKRQSERIECRVEIKLRPCIGYKILHTGIKRCGTRQRQA